MPNYPLPNGTFLSLPDGLSEEEIQKEILNYQEKFLTPTVDEETVATTSTVEEILQDPTPEFDPYDLVAPRLRPEESYDEGDPYRKQVEAGLESTILSHLSLEDLNDLILETEAAQEEYNQLIRAEETRSLSEEEVKRKQELYITLEGTGKSTSLPDMAPNIGAPGTIPVIPTQMILAEEKGRLGLKKYTSDAMQAFSSLQESIDEVEVSDAFKWVMEQSVDTTGEQGFFEGSKKAFLTFWNDLNWSQKGDFIGDVLGRSTVATSAIVATSFGLGALTKPYNWAVKGLTQLIGVGTLSGEIEYSHSMHEYLRANGLDVNDPESIKAIMGNEKLLEEAHDYSLKRGGIIGIIDGITGGIATKIIAPSVITRSHHSVMPFIKKPVGMPVSPVTRHSVNFVAQTPLQTGLPAGAEYFAQLATLEEGETISMGEVLAEAVGEFAFVPADMVLGGISANQEIKNLTATKKEVYQRVVEYLQIQQGKAKQKGLEDLTGEIYADIDAEEITVAGGLPYFDEAFELFLQNEENINTFANTDADIIAPNQFFVAPDGQGGYVILDTYNEKFGNIYDSKTEAGNVAGALNAISGANYATNLKNAYATMQGLNVDAEENPLVNKLGNEILNPYFGQIDIQDVNESPNVNSAAYERLINAVGRDATGIDILSLKGVLPEADINRLLDIKAKKLYQDANVGKNLPSNITVKMFENLGKKLNLNIDTNSNGFKSLALRLTGESNVNKLNNIQKRLIYAFLNTLPAHEGNTISLPDFSSRPYTLDEYNQVVDSLNAGQTPTIPNIVLALGLNPNNLADKRTATRLRQDLVSAGIVDKKGSKYKFNANGEWSLNRAQQAAIDSDPQTRVELQEIQKFRSLLSGFYEKMGMPEVAVKLDNAIQTRVGQSNPEADGMFDPIWSEILLNVAKAREQTTNEQEVLENLTKTLGHELWHAAKFLDLFSVQEIANLNKYVTNNELNEESAIGLLGKENLKILTDTLGRKPTYLEAIEYRYNTLDNQDLNSEALLEEANALLFEDHIIKNIKLAGQPRALMERTKKFFTAIDNGMNELGFQTYEDVFDKLISGEIGARERVDETVEPVEVQMRDEYGRPRGSYKVQPRAVRTNRILENEWADWIRATETSIGSENYPESADRDSPLFERPLQDAPNLKYKLSETQQRPTALTQEYWRGAADGDYGNDINEIGETLFSKDILNNTDIIRRWKSYGRTVENSEAGVTQRQLYNKTQEFLKIKNYPDQFKVYLVGDIDRTKSGIAVTNNLEEAKNIANEFVDPPFQILGDRKKITEYTINAGQIVLDKDVMFGLKTPVWAQPSLPKTDFLLAGSSGLATSPNQPVTYQEETPPEGRVRRKITLGTPKPKYKISHKILYHRGPEGIEQLELRPDRFGDHKNALFFLDKPFKSSYGDVLYEVEALLPEGSSIQLGNPPQALIQELDAEIERTATEPGARFELTELRGVLNGNKWFGGTWESRQVLREQGNVRSLTSRQSEFLLNQGVVHLEGLAVRGLPSFLQNRTSIVLDPDVLNIIGVDEVSVDRQSTLPSPKLKLSEPRDESSGHVADYVPPQYGPPAHQLDLIQASDVSPEGYSTASFGFRYPYATQDIESARREFLNYSTARTPLEQQEEREFINKLMDIKGNPNATITMYQAAPSRDLREGDIITPFLSDAEALVEDSKVTQQEIRDADRARRRQEQIDKTGAVDLQQERLFNQMEGISDILGRREVTPSRVHTYQIRAGDVRWDGNNGWARWGYFPRIKAVEDIRPKYKLSSLEDGLTGVKAQEIAPNYRRYPTPYYREGQATPEERKLLKKQKLSAPMDDVAFESSKKDLLKLIDQGVDVVELETHPAVVEGMSRMFEIESTADQYINKLGENWSTENAYLNNRKFIINNKVVRGVRKAKAELKKKAESYSNNPVENNKQAWLVLGATASGKSYFSEKLAKERNLAIVDSDDAKKIIPEYEGGVGANAVHVEASMITSSVRNDFIKEGKDILLPRVGGLPKRKAIQSTIKELQDAGYNIKTVLVDVDYKSALGRMYNRFAETGRLVPPSYIEETKNTPIDTYHRVKYTTDGYAWIDNNGTKNQEIIRQDTGILPDALTRGRGESRRIRRESSEENERSSFPEEEVTIQEALEGVRGINERLVSAGLAPKFNLNASADAIRAAYIAELKQPDAGVIPSKLRPKYSLKDSGSKLNDKTEDLIKKVTIRDSFDSEPSMGRIILETAKGYATEDSIREILVDRYARFKTVEIQAARARGMKEEALTADVSGVSALMFSDRAGEVFRSALIEGIPVYDEKGYVRVETVSPIDGQPVEPPLKFLQPAFENPQLMWAFQAVRIAKREKRFNAEGKPVKTTAKDRKDAAQALKDYPELQKMSDAYDRWDQHVVKFLVDTGVLDVDTAKQWTAHADYFPFYRMIGQDKDGNFITKGPQIFKGLSSGKNIFVKAKGSADKDIVDPITGIGENLRAAITLGMKNVAANRVVRDMVDAGFAEQVPLNSTGFNVVKIRVGGKTKAFRVDDVNLYEAFQNFEGGAINFGGFFSRLTAYPKEALSALITRTPDFWIRQVLRDSISAQTILGGNFIPLGTSLKNWGKVWAGMIANKLPFTERDFVPEGVSKMRRAGIVSGYDTVVRDIDNSQKLIKSAYDKAGINNRNTAQQVLMFPFDAIKSVWNFVGDGTISSDAATRLAVYEDILEKTGNEAEAVFQAMEVLNFTRRGKNPLMQYFATVIPFMNPRLQGVDVFYRGARGKYGQPQTSAQARRRAFAFRMGMLASLTPLYFFLVKDSDEYKEASEDIRDNYYIIPFSKKLFGETIGIPIPFEVGLMTKTVPERILRYYNEDETFKEMFTGMMRRVGQSLSIDPRQATFLNAPIENITNYDFYTGQPVVPYYMKDLDPQLQYRPSTNNLWKELGDEMNVSPLYLDNLWKGYTGTIGNWVANATDSFSREYLDMPPRQAFRLDEMPAVGALLLDPEGRGLENEFYTLKETTDNLLKSMKEAEKRITEGGDEFAYHLTDEYRFEYMETLKLLTEDLNNISKVLSESRLEETRILNDRTISSEEKTDQLTDLRDTRNFILKGIGERRIELEKGLFEDIRGAL